MSSQSSDLEQFHRFVGEQIAQGSSDLTPEDCLDVWRANHPSPDELTESTAAILRALNQAARGEGVAFHEFDRAFRAEHGIPSSDE
jgi:hypothetical protein